MMRIVASIPVRMIENASWFRFEAEPLAVEVVRVIRHGCDRTRRRYYYQADVIPPPGTHPRALAIYADAQALLRVSISRPLNPRWRPPAFPMGSNIWQATTPVSYPQNPGKTL